MKKFLIVSLVIILNIGTTQVQALAPRAFQGLENLPYDCLYEISSYFDDEEDFDNFMLTCKAIYSTTDIIRSNEPYTKWVRIRNDLIDVYKKINNGEDLALEQKEKLKNKTQKEKCYYLKKLTIKCYNEVKKEIDYGKQEKFSLETQIKIVFILLSSSNYKEIWGGKYYTFLSVLHTAADKIDKDHINKLIEMLENKKYKEVWGGKCYTILHVLHAASFTDKLDKDNINKLIEMLGNNTYKDLWGRRGFYTILSVVGYNGDKLDNDHINKLIEILKNDTCKNVWGGNPYTILHMLCIAAWKKILTEENINKLIEMLGNEKYKEIWGGKNYTILHVLVYANALNSILTEENINNLIKKLGDKNTFLKHILSFESLNKSNTTTLSYILRFMNYELKTINKNHTNIEKIVELKNAFIYSIGGMNKADLNQLIEFYSKISKPNLIKKASNFFKEILGYKKTNTVEKIIELLGTIKSNLGQDEKIPKIELTDNISKKISPKIEKAVYNAFKVICEA
jgi:hypothetical protein